MSAVDAGDRPEPPTDGDEVASLLGFLDFQRATFAWKCSGLDAAGLSATVGASSLTLGGLLAHLAFVEDDWFGHDLLGRERVVSPEDAWTAVSHDPEQLRARWSATVERSRAVVAEVLADDGLDRRAVHVWPDGRVPTLRWILLHMIEEYARHNGHADLLREAVDGAVGE